MAPDPPVAVVFGTRPELIKLAAVVRLLGDQARTYHTGQHFDSELSSAMSDELGLERPFASLAVGGRGRAGQIGEAVLGLERLFETERPGVVVVQGDTNSALAGALVANAQEIPLVHVEAGLRSFDRAMPEEHNRVMIDHLSDVCCAPTQRAHDYLRAENITEARITVTGNTVVGAVLDMLPNNFDRARILAEYGLTENEFVLATLHRPENVDGAEQLSLVLDGLIALDVPVVLALHPRTKDRAERFGLSDRLAKLQVIPSLGYSKFLGLLAGCALAVSDSGGIQEEVTVVGRPLLVVRRSTERAEGIGVWSQIIPATKIESRGRELLEDPVGLRQSLAMRPSPYGDAHAAERIVAAIHKITDRDAFEGGEGDTGRNVSYSIDASSRKVPRS